MIEKGIFITPFPLALITVWLTVWLWPSTGAIQFLSFGLVANFTPWTILTGLALALYSYKAIPHNKSLAPTVASSIEFELSRIRTPAATDREHVVLYQGDASSPSSSPAIARSSTSGVRKTKDFKVLTYNLYLRPPFINSNGNDWKNERLREFMKVMTEYDIICLQEVFGLGNKRQQQLIDFARRKHYHVVKCIPPPFLSLKFIDAGLLILSKYPIVDCDGYIYTSGHQIDFYASKQVLYAKIRVAPDQHVHVFTTHMQASYYENAEHINLKNDSIRQSQVMEMIKFARSRIPAEDLCRDPIILSGDFNAPARANPDDPTVSSNDYVQMMELIREEFPEFEVSDALYDASGNTHPVTYGDVVIDSTTGQKRPKELVLTNAADYCCQLCIDYMIWLTPSSKQASKASSGIELLPNSTRVEPFFIDPSIGPYRFDQLSDHYGISSYFRVSS